jgi:serine/threonine-protein kinase RsbT
VTAAVLVAKQTHFQLGSELDVLTARRGVRDWARDLGLSTLDATKVVTATSELARNTVVHGGGGVMCLEVVRQANRQGLRVSFQDHGPGIPQIDLAMKDGFTTARGMGIGLPGAKRLVDDFELSSTAAEGTRVTIVRWKV